MKYRLLKSSLLGRPLDPTQTIFIVGGGIAGLMLAYHLKKAKVGFKLYEKAERAGGVLGTVKGQYGIAETAANGFLWCQEIIDMCQDLKVDLVYPNKVQKARYLVKNHKLRKMPLNVFQLTAAIARAALPHSQNINTLREFGETYFGTSMTDYILEPAMSGIYSGLANELSFPGAMSSIAKILNQHKSLVWGGLQKMTGGSKNPNKISGTIGLKNGMGSLVEALSEHLKNEIEYDTIVDKDFVQKNECVLCVPAYVAQNYFDGPIAQQLTNIEYTSNISITSFVKKEAVPKFKAGFGCLISRKENVNILGILFNSCIFDHRVVSDDLLSLTCILRDFDGRLSTLNDAALLDLVNREMGLVLGLQDTPLEQHIFRWPKGIPLYTPYLYESWFELNDVLQSQHPNIRLFGNYTGQISIRGMCEQAAKVI